MTGHTSWSRLLERKKELDALIASEGKDALKERFKEFFAENPIVAKLRWRQYTPYFNDGDPCEFGVHDPEYLLTTDNQDAAEWEEEWRFAWYSRRDTPAPEEVAVKQLGLELQAQEEVLHAVFGDHVQVFVTPTEVLVEEYEHD